MTNTTPLAVEMRDISKRFPGVLANDRVDLTINRGEIHALLGENGAGKSTLMNILAGLYLPEQGNVLVHGQPVHIDSPKTAFDLGIAMVHQHFKLVMNQSVAENIILGLDDPYCAPSEQGRFRPLRLDMLRVQRRIAEVSEQYDMFVDPEAFIWQLSVGEQQRIEILKALYRGADILILDEPTAVLTPQEADALGQTMQRMVQEGKTIIFISHKLDEVTRFADRVTVLRRGRVVATEDVTGETSAAHLAELMVGRAVIFRIDKEEQEFGEDLSGGRRHQLPEREALARPAGCFAADPQGGDTRHRRRCRQRAEGTGRTVDRSAAAYQRTLSFTGAGPHQQIPAGHHRRRHRPHPGKPYPRRLGRIDERGRQHRAQTLPGQAGAVPGSGQAGQNERATGGRVQRGHAGHCLPMQAPSPVGICKN